jgi:hypothetical protein
LNGGIVFTSSLAKRAKSTSQDAKWTKQEDRVVIRGTKKDWSTKRILLELDKLTGAPLRSANGVRSRRKYLKDMDLWDDEPGESPTRHVKQQKS